MSDEAVVVPGPGPGDLTAGMLLRQARESTGLHVAALAVSMKVPVKKLEALEADRLEELPDAVFIRALAASVCRTLKVDPAPVLSKLPQSVVPKLDQSDRGVSMPTQGPNFLAGNPLTALLSRPTVLLVAVLLLAALVVVLLPETRSSVGMAAMTKAEPAEPMAATVASAAVAAAPAAAPALEASAQAPAVVPAVAAIQAPASAPVVAPVKVASANVTASSDASPATDGVLVFKAKSRAWIRVSDSKGVVQFEKTLASGESATASGVLPLSVIVGNVAATEVVLRGQPFPLDTLTQNNVARFEVK